MNKKKILFVYNEMIIGGSTTSLLSILNSLDYNYYSVDLLLYYNKGTLLHKIPSNVNILPQASLYPMTSKGIKIVRSLLVGDIQKSFLYGLLLDRKISLNRQAMSYSRVTNSRKLKNKYDIAVGFLEGWSNAYVARRVKAKRKIIWIHTDYKESCMNLRIDRGTFKRADQIVTVSQKSLQNFCEVAPEFSRKAIYIDNMISQKIIRVLSKDYDPNIIIDKNKINLITVCRIDFTSKGLDRGVVAFEKLKETNTLKNYHWYIIGNGKDCERLKMLISDYDLDKNITLLGEMENPFPYVILMDAFFLPSRYEGKPMAVTESLMLGIPAIVTEYISAHEQLKDGEDGIIIENNDPSIYITLSDLVQKKKELEIMKMNANNKDYSNYDSIKELFRIIK